MKPFFRLLATGLLLAATQPPAHAFEGKVSLLMTVERGRTMNIEYAFKGQKVRTELNAEGHRYASITDLARSETIMLLPERRTYMLSPQVDKTDQRGDDYFHPGDVKITAKTDTILGHTCNQMLVKDGKIITEVWVTKELGAFVGMGQGGIPIGSGFSSSTGALVKWEEALNDQGGFPLRVISRDAKGRQTFLLETTKIEPSSLSDSLFTPPAGYRKIEMPKTEMPKADGGPKKAGGN